MDKMDRFYPTWFWQTTSVKHFGGWAWSRHWLMLLHWPASGIVCRCTLERTRCNSMWYPYFPCWPKGSEIACIDSVSYSPIQAENRITMIFIIFFSCNKFHRNQTKTFFGRTLMCIIQGESGRTTQISGVYSAGQNNFKKTSYIVIRFSFVFKLKGIRIFWINIFFSLSLLLTNAVGADYLPTYLFDYLHMSIRVDPFGCSDMY